MQKCGKEIVEMNKEVVLKAIYARIIDVYDRTRKYKNTPNKVEAKNELLDLCQAYFEIKGNSTIENLDTDIVSIKASVEKW